MIPSLFANTMSFNATIASYYPSTEDIYANTDFSSLNWFEKQWAGFYILIGNPVIATGLMGFLLHEVCLYLFGHI
jgi:methylsterol monooxygenase